MADVTGAPVPVGTDPFDVPGDLQALADHFGAPTKYSVANVAALPASGNWEGRLLLAADTDVLYTWTGSAWVAINEFKAYARASRTTALSVASSGNPAGGANTALVFNTNDFSSFVTYGTGGLTFQVDGLYMVRTRISFAANGTGYRYVTLKVNAVGIDSAVGTAALNNGANHSTDLSNIDFLPFSAGEVLSLDVGQASGAALNLNAGAKLEVWRMGPKLYSRA